MFVLPVAIALAVGALVCLGIAGARFLHHDGENSPWEQALVAGLLAACSWAAFSGYGETKATESESAQRKDSIATITHAVEAKNDVTVRHHPAAGYSQTDEHAKPERWHVESLRTPDDWQLDEHWYRCYIAGDDADPELYCSTADGYVAFDDFTEQPAGKPRRVPLPQTAPHNDQETSRASR